MGGVSPAALHGAEILCTTLAALGVEYVFGVPGTQNVELYDALRRSTLRSILTTHELGAAFMANGYARASGKVGVVVTIPGPGFAFTLAGLAEAKLDSVPLLLITGQPAQGPGRAFRHQAIDQAAIARPLVKGVVEVERAEELGPAVVRAYELATQGEPGPVMLHTSAQAMSGTAADTPLVTAPFAGGDATEIDAVAARFLAARRPVILAGQGAAGAAADLRRLAERWTVPVVTTPAGRGVLPEDHPLALGFDHVRGNVVRLNQLLQRADCILAVGCKLAQNGTAGFALQLPPDRFIHVDTATSVLGANYPAQLAVCARAEQVFERLVQRCEGRSAAPVRVVCSGAGYVAGPVTRVACARASRAPLPGRGRRHGVQRCLRRCAKPCRTTASSSPTADCISRSRGSTTKCGLAAGSSFRTTSNRWVTESRRRSAPGSPRRPDRW